MSDLEKIITSYGYKLENFSDCQIETFNMAVENQLELKTIINPQVDELIMNVVVHETITMPEKVSMLPYLYPGITFSQLGDIRQASQAGDMLKVDKFLELFHKKDISIERKNSIARLIERELDYTDLLDASLKDEEVLQEVRDRTRRTYDVQAMLNRSISIN